MSILLPMLRNKTTKHWRGSWTIPKEARPTDPGNSGGPEIRDIWEGLHVFQRLISYKMSPKKCHPKGAFSNSSQAHTWKDSITYCIFFPLNNSLMVLFSISHIFLSKFPFLLTYLFYETYLLIYSYMHLCFTLASPVSLLLVLPAPKHSWHYRSQLTLKIRAGEISLSP